MGEKYFSSSRHPAACPRRSPLPRPFSSCSGSTTAGRNGTYAIPQLVLRGRRSEFRERRLVFSRYRGTKLEFEKQRGSSRRGFSGTGAVPRMCGVFANLELVGVGVNGDDLGLNGPLQLLSLHGTVWTRSAMAFQRLGADGIFSAFCFLLCFLLTLLDGEV